MQTRRSLNTTTVCRPGFDATTDDGDDNDDDDDDDYDNDLT